MGYTYSMRFAPATLAALLMLAAGASPALAQGGGSLGTTQTAKPAAVRSLDGSLKAGMRQAGNYSGADVVDLTTGQTLYSHNAGTGRLPASVEKLYTTTTALTRFGAGATLTTSILGNGTMDGSTYVGTLYLRGGGDPTFGSAAFDHAAYGTGATIQQLVANLVRATGMRSLKGNVVADETYFDSVRGTPATGGQPNTEVEGELSALAFNGGWTSIDEESLVTHPALTAGQQLIAALRADRVNVPNQTRVTAGRTPAGAAPLATVHSPSMATLIALTNAPSDNFFAEMLLKDLGARFGGAGTTAAGAAVVRAQVAKSFGIHPRLNDGSGLSRYDLTTPVQVVTLLTDEASNAQFTNSLAVAGETGTLQDEMQGTYAEGRCRGKTGTLHDVSNLVGYCAAGDGHTLAFAFLMNGIYPDYAHPIQDRMAVAVAKYDG